MLEAAAGGGHIALGLAVELGDPALGVVAEEAQGFGWGVVLEPADLAPDALDVLEVTVAVERAWVHKIVRAAAIRHDGA